MKIIFNVLLFSVFVLNVINGATPEKTEYQIVKRIPVEGDGGWDYISIDEPTGRLFVSHGMVTQVVDSKSGKLLGTIEDTKGVHGVAFVNEENKAFISCGKDSSVTIINLTTLVKIDKIKVTGANPDAIIYDPYSKKVFAFNGKSSNVTVIDSKTNLVTGTIQLNGDPEFAVSDGSGKIYLNIEDKSLVAVINTQTMTVEKYWSVSPGEEPSGLAFDHINHILFSVCDNKKMIVMNAVYGKVVESLPIGGRVDGCAFDQKLKRAYSSNGEGTVTVVQEDSPEKFSIIENITTQKGARTICIDQTTHHLFLPTAEYGDVPEATKEKPHPRPAIKPGTFVIIEIAPVK